MDIEQLKEKTNYVSVTGIIRKSIDGQTKYLICKRSPNEKAFPNKWCVPGGKIEQKDFVASPKDTKDHWVDIFEKTLNKEMLEETNLKIKNIRYVSSLVFIRPNGFSTIIVSLYADYDSGNVVLSNEELADYAWVDLEEAKRYDLIENIYEQIVEVEKKYRKEK
jgi:8-oxo-dGTP pyrophosphatase MutT (NUDIX family)